MLLENSHIIEPKWPQIKIKPNSIYNNNGKEYWFIIFFFWCYLKNLYSFIAAVIYEQIFGKDSSVYNIEDILPIPLVVIICVILANFMYGAQHYVTHKIQCLWRIFHQMHHTQHRFHSYLSLWGHPSDVMYITIGQIIVKYIWGLAPETLFIITFIEATLGIIVHANIRTPYYLGFIIMRPVAHVLHHEEPWDHNGRPIESF